VRNSAGNKNGCQPGGSFPSSCGMRALRGTDCFAGATAGFTAKPQMVAWGCKHTCACGGRDQYRRAGRGHLLLWMQVRLDSKSTTTVKSWQRKHKKHAGTL
jgi:hypothetical protein